jgi:ABC-2 type transport system permease protein
MTATTLRPAAPAPVAVPGTDAGVPFSRLLRAEGRKAVDTRSARWILAIVAVATAGLAFVPVAFPDALDQTLPGYLGLAQIGLMVLLPIVAIMTVTTEWTQRTVLSTFTQEPRRVRVLAAKLLTVSWLAAVASIGSLAFAAGALALSSALGRSVSWEVGARVGVGTLLAILQVAWMGVAFGAALQNTALAVVLYYVLPVAWSMLAIVPAITDAAAWLDTNMTLEWLASGQWDGHGGQIAVSLAVWVAAPLVFGAARALRREVK